MTAWPFGELAPFSYELIMADPPWEFRVWSEKGEAKSPQAQYETMPIEAIRDLPVGHLAARDCILFLWCTWPLLLDGGDPGRDIPGRASHSPVGSIIEAWGFRYVTGGSWLKRTRTGKTAFGTGYRVRSACEPWLIAVNGKPDTSRAARNVIAGLARQHSRKPDEAYRWCELYMPAARRLDLFSRQSRPGWDQWGNEAGKFNPSPTLEAAA
jgi:N6-adenosine-specific RNA methylase IME4